MMASFLVDHKVYEYIIRIEYDRVFIYGKMFHSKTGRISYKIYHKVFSMIFMAAQHTDTLHFAYFDVFVHWQVSLQQMRNSVDY